MAYLKAGVGEGYPNRKSDVTTVQILLNKWIVPGGVPVVRTALDVDGLFGPKTGFAIISFKLSNFLEFPALNHIQPRSSTLSKLDGPLPSHLFPVPADGPGPAPAPKSKPKPKTGLTRAEREKVEELIREHSLSGKDAIVVRDFVNAASDVHAAITQIDDVIDIFNSFKWAGGIAQMSTASALIGIAGPIFMFIGFVCTVNDVMERDAKHYTAIAVAFWLVSWAHGRPMPKGCSEMKRKFLYVNDHYTSGYLDAAWSKGVKAGPKVLEKYLNHIYINTPSHMTRTKCKNGVRLIWSETSPTRLVRAFLRAMRKSFYDTAIFGVLESESAGSALFFDFHVPKIDYG